MNRRGAVRLEFLWNHLLYACIQLLHVVLNGSNKSEHSI